VRIAGIPGDRNQGGREVRTPARLPMGRIRHGSTLRTRMLSAPVLVLFFNRPRSLRLVLDRVLAASPRRVYLACDGPRRERLDDQELIGRCRDLAMSYPWASPAVTRFLEVNEGCAGAVSGALSWFFAQEPEGIVLEDDCVPDPTFFRFAAELLDRYRDDERVMSVNGSNFDVRPRDPRSPSYGFIRSPHVWGWASWARAWRLHELHLTQEAIDALPLENYPSTSGVSIRKWRKRFRSVSAGTPSTWDFQWAFAHLRNGGLVASPRRNLVTNIFSESGTHLQKRSLWQELPTSPMPFPLRHPPTVELDADLQRHLERVHCNHRTWLLRKVHQLAERHRLVPAAWLRRGFGGG
jgi:hypothetical protein